MPYTWSWSPVLCGTLVDQVMAFVPKLVAGGILILIVWIIATVLRTIVTKALQSTTMDEKLSAGAGMRPMSDNLGNVVFWLVVLLFLPAILGTLEIDGLLNRFKTWSMKC